MNADDTKRLQARLGVAVDGDFGRGTWSALFRKLGAAVHVPAYGIDGTPLRLAHFLAQLGHESGGFIYMQEIASGQAYEGRADLGNTQEGDGRRYKGRGPIQLTGRSNYRKYGRRIGIDLEGNPEIAAIPSIGMLTACLYWDEHKLNALADADDVVTITRRINGGLNGLDDRRARLARAKALIL